MSDTESRASALGVWPGDRIRFVVSDGEVRLLTAQSLLAEVWANNHDGDTGDSVADVRRERTADDVRRAAKLERTAAAQESRSEDEIEAGLLAQLGLG